MGAVEPVSTQAVIVRTVYNHSETTSLWLCFTVAMLCGQICYHWIGSTTSSTKSSSEKENTLRSSYMLESNSRSVCIEPSSIEEMLIHRPNARLNVLKQNVWRMESRLSYFERRLFHAYELFRELSFCTLVSFFRYVPLQTMKSCLQQNFSLPWSRSPLLQRFWSKYPLHGPELRSISFTLRIPHFERVIYDEAMRPITTYRAG